MIVGLKILKSATGRTEKLTDRQTWSVMDKVMDIGSYKMHVNENQEICGKLVVKLVVF